jgi:hypothetical protein
MSVSALAGLDLLVYGSHLSGWFLFCCAGISSLCSTTLYYKKIFPALVREGEDGGAPSACSSSCRLR